MTDEDILDCILDVDRVLQEVESAIRGHDMKMAMNKLKYARGVIEDLREEDTIDMTRNVEMDMMNVLR